MSHHSDDRPRLHVHGTLLPDGEQVDLWIVDGRISRVPVDGARTVARGCWIMPGFVDAHCHIGLDGRGAVEPDVAERQALTDRNAGTLLVRDAGSASDTHWMDQREDLPRIVRAGRHIARPKRYLRNYADEVEPDELVAAVERQAARGDGWVKLIGDWIDRDRGDLAPLWPKDVAEKAIEAAHRAGARVTAHCFGEESVVELVEAGIDCIEHGTGMDDSVIEAMVSRGVALVPTMVNLENFPSIADSAEAKFPAYAAHMRDLFARRFDTIGRAYRAGVQIYAGTDAGGTVPHGLIGREIELLSQVGGAEFALGAASWRARSWLGRPGVADGDPADLVLLAEDPREVITTVQQPLSVVLNGFVVSGGAANTAL